MTRTVSVEKIVFFGITSLTLPLRSDSLSVDPLYDLIFFVAWAIRMITHAVGRPLRLVFQVVGETRPLS